MSGPLTLLKSIPHRIWSLQVSMPSIFSTEEAPHTVGTLSSGTDPRTPFDPFPRSTMPFQQQQAVDAVYSTPGAYLLIVKDIQSIDIPKGNGPLNRNSGTCHPDRSPAGVKMTKIVPKSHLTAASSVVNNSVAVDPPKENPPECTAVQSRKAEVVGDYVMFKPRIGHGKYGDVFECKHSESKKIYVLKVMSKRKVEKLIQTEVALQKKLKHPNIVELHEFLQTKDDYYIDNDQRSGPTDMRIIPCLFPSNIPAVKSRELSQRSRYADLHDQAKELLRVTADNPVLAETVRKVLDEVAVKLRTQIEAKTGRLKVKDPAIWPAAGKVSNKRIKSGQEISMDSKFKAGKDKKRPR